MIGDTRRMQLTGGQSKGDGMHLTTGNRRMLVVGAAVVAAVLSLTSCGRNAAPAVSSPTSGGLDPAGPTVTAPSTESTSSTRPTQLTYIIQPGDSLSLIAERFGVDARALADFNAIADLNAIKVGQELSIPPATTGG